MELCAEAVVAVWRQVVATRMRLSGYIVEEHLDNIPQPWHIPAHDSVFRLKSGMPLILSSGSNEICQFSGMCVAVSFDLRVAPPIASKMRSMVLVVTVTPMVAMGHQGNFAIGERRRSMYHHIPFTLIF